MSKHPSNKSQPEIVLATKEARELYRIRESFTFRLGIEMIRSIRNPFLIFSFPFRIISQLFSRKENFPQSRKIQPSGVLLIGIDRVGDVFSTQAQSLAQIISDSGLFDVTLFNNSNKLPEGLREKEWYRLPPIREKGKSRKEWNITAERLLSSVISISNPEHIIFLGDYLYRGIVDALVPIDSNIPITWFLTSSINKEEISIEKLPNIEPISLPEFSNISFTSQSLHHIFRRSESKKILLTDVNPKNKTLVNSIMQYNERFLLTAIERDYPSHEGIELVVRKKEITGMQLEGDVVVILDDESPLLPSLAILGVPCFLLRTGKELSPIINEMIRDMELKGALVVVRRESSNEIIHGLEYLVAFSQEVLNNRSLVKSTNLAKPTDYVVKWLKKGSQSYN